MPIWKDILRDRLGSFLPEPVKSVFEIAYSYSPTWALWITVIVAIIFHIGWKFLPASIGRRVAIEMLTTPLKHETYKRTADVDYLVDELNRLTRSNPEQEVHVIISGGPGAGKSELIARQVGERIFQSENKRIFSFDLSFVLPPTDVITLNADDFNVLQSTLEEAVDKIQGKEPKPMGYDCIGNEETIFAKFHQLRVALRSRSSLTSHPVIIFDNVKGPMFTFLYKKRPNGKFFLNARSKEYGEIRIIVTTQRQPTTLFRSVMGYKDMFKPMSTNEAVKLLNTITNIQNDDQNASYLANALGGLPKSLADAAIYIQMDTIRRHNASYRFYLQELELNRRRYLSNVDFAWAEGTDHGLTYNFTAYTASLMLVGQYFHDSSHGRFYEALAFIIGYCGSPAISLKLLVKYVGLDDVLRAYSEFEVKTLIEKTSLYDVKTSYAEHSLISTHQVTRYASFDAWNKRIENEKDQSERLIETSIARIFDVLTSELTSKHDPSLNQMAEYTSLSFKVVDVVMSLVKVSLSQK